MQFLERGGGGHLPQMPHPGSATATGYMIVMMPQKAHTVYSILMYECYASVVSCLLCYYRYEASIPCQPKARAAGGKTDVHDVQ